jgi:hypothetical protein
MLLFLPLTVTGAIPAMCYFFNPITEVISLKCQVPFLHVVLGEIPTMLFGITAMLLLYRVVYIPTAMYFSPNSGVLRFIHSLRRKLLAVWFISSNESPHTRVIPPTF